MTTTEFASEYEAEQIVIELDDEERRLTKADAALGEVLATYRIAERRYIAIRELARERLGNSPYAVENEHVWPSRDMTERPFRGNYRYRGMKIGNAIAEYLADRPDTPQTLADIYFGLRQGGLSHASRRAVNAALMKLNNIRKTLGGTYFYTNEETAFLSSEQDSDYDQAAAEVAESDYA